MSIDFNALPLEIREVCAKECVKTMISQLERDKLRLKRHYNAMTGEMNAHIKNLERSLK